jgi:hypothetical protein
MTPETQAQIVRIRRPALRNGCGAAADFTGDDDEFYFDMRWCGLSSRRANCPPPTMDDASRLKRQAADRS